MTAHIKSISHIAIAPNDTAGFVKVLKILGLTPDQHELVASERTKTTFVKISRPANTHDHLEIVEDAGTVEDPGPIGKYLAKKGSGIHHIAFEVEGIEEFCEKLNHAGVRITSDGPKLGAHNSRVVFIHPKDVGGILIELVESLK